MVGYLFCLVDLQLATLSRVDSVAKLVGRLDTESLKDELESLNSVSASLPS
jgi:hypothetical protein